MELSSFEFSSDSDLILTKPKNIKHTYLRPSLFYQPCAHSRKNSSDLKRAMHVDRIEDEAQNMKSQRISIGTVKVITERKKNVLNPK